MDAMIEKWVEGLNPFQQLNLLGVLVILGGIAAAWKAASLAWWVIKLIIGKRD